MRIKAKLVMATIGIVAVILLMRVLSPDTDCPDGQVAGSTIAGTPVCLAMADPVSERSAAEMRGLLRFAHGLGLDEETVRGIYEAVGREAMATGASDDERMAEIRKRMLLAVNCYERSPSMTGQSSTRAGSGTGARLVAAE
ncbi:hypothetical protein [Methylorubrum extorquens]|uniref:Uncharacterized protein n=1 Tax=Methylorubrum extorquens (strain CM4 / NCIMB 13688) TaxID=440085 RepID=B7KRS3_METC4|nr:hypothetical protein [Methylorubrum extorquens]ACK85600.1 hypothetical protein Mchl_4833 [Methylorubrum extorquens CM4]